MQTRLVPPLLLTSLSLVLLQEVMGSHPSASCLRITPLQGARTRVTFLREDESGARALYVTLWSEENLRLVTCDVNDSPLVTESYLRVCGSSDTQQQQQQQQQQVGGTRFNLSALEGPGAPCEPAPSPGLSTEFSHAGGGGGGGGGAVGKVRRKRGWIFPGTLWCGRGSKAVRYEDLGMFENADKCCREHDHCSHIIPSFTVNYGVFNSYFYTLSHCDCDQRFRQCLVDVNDTIASMVGYSFFNIMRIPCFEIRQQRRCTQMYWWGMCKVSKEAPYAIVKNCLPYNSVDDSDSHNTASPTSSIVTQSPAKSPLPTPPSKRKHRCGSRSPPRGDTFYPGKKERRCKTTHATAPSSLLNTSNRNEVVPHHRRAGKKKSERKVVSVPPQTSTTESHPQASSSTTPSFQSVTHHQPKLHPPTAETMSLSNHKVSTEQSGCCGSRRGDTFAPLCNSCPGQETETPTHRTETPAASVTARVKNSACRCKKDKLLKQLDSDPRGNEAVQKHSGDTLTQSGKRSFTLNNAVVTDAQLLCESLKHLDDCKYKIPPLESKYNVHNNEPKTVYHCDCTTRLGLQIQSFRRPSVLPALLTEFISQSCLKLPNTGRRCHRRKSCSGGLTKASDLFGALKKMEERDSGGVQDSGNKKKRGIPVRLYKRCLRLERGADNMAALT